MQKWIAENSGRMLSASISLDPKILLPCEREFTHYHMWNIWTFSTSNTHNSTTSICSFVNHLKPPFNSPKDRKWSYQLHSTSEDRHFESSPSLFQTLLPSPFWYCWSEWYHCHGGICEQEWSVQAMFIRLLFLPIGRDSIYATEARKTQADSKRTHGKFHSYCGWCLEVWDFQLELEVSDSCFALSVLHPTNRPARMRYTRYSDRT